MLAVDMQAIQTDAMIAVRTGRAAPRRALTPEKQRLWRAAYEAAFAAKTQRERSATDEKQG